MGSPPRNYLKENYTDFVGGLNDSKSFDLGGPERKITIGAPIPIDGPFGQDSTGVGMIFDVPF
ncbi:MAG: hypothetical protein R3B74_16785 [Nitrospirales bacterium]|nr:hypothetical protein [Nitrospirales bacterium]